MLTGLTKRFWGNQPFKPAYSVCAGMWRVKWKKPLLSDYQNFVPPSCWEENAAFSSLHVKTASCSWGNLRNQCYFVCPTLPPPGQEENVHSGYQKCNCGYQKLKAQYTWTVNMTSFVLGRMTLLFLICEREGGGTSSSFLSTGEKRLWVPSAYSGKTRILTRKNVFKINTKCNHLKLYVPPLSQNKKT